MSRTIAKGAFFLSLAQNINLFASIISSAILARLLSQDDLGIYKQTIMVFDLIYPFLLLSLPEAVYYFMPKKEVNVKQLVFNNFCILMLLGFFTFLIMLFFKTLFSIQFNNPHLNSTLPIYALYPLFFFPVQSLSAILIVKEKSFILSVWTVITNSIQVLAVILVTVLTKDYIHVLQIRVCIQFFVFLGSLLIINKTISFFSDKTKIYIDFLLIKKMFLYALPLGLSSLMGTFCVKLDKLVVSMNVSPDQFAIYNNGAIEVPIIGSIIGSISSVAIVSFVKMWNEKDKKGIADLFKSIGSKTCMILFPALVYFIFWGQNFINLLYSEKYTRSFIPFFIYLFALPARIVQYGPVIQAMGKNKMLFYRSIGDLIINVIFNILFVKVLGMYGAAIATIAVLYLWSVPYNMIIIKKGLSCRIRDLFNFKHLFFVLLISFIAVSGTLWLRIFDFNYFESLIYSFVCFSIFYLICIYIYDRKIVIEIINLFRR